MSMTPAKPPIAPPQRMAVLSTEAVDVLYRLGAADRIAGVSGFTVYPPQARTDKPKVSGFKTGKIEKIMGVQPDLVIGYSRLQRQLLDECEALGARTLWFNHRDIAGIFDMVRELGEHVGAAGQAEALNQRLQAVIDRVRAAAATLPRRPRVYFEEWHTPLTCGILWGSQLIEVAGGQDVFAHVAPSDPFSARAVTPEQVLQARPELIFGSWCGQRFDTAQVAARPGWAELGARLQDIPSCDILAPGPVAIEKGLLILFASICRHLGVHPTDTGLRLDDLGLSLSSP